MSTTMLTLFDLNKKLEYYRYKKPLKPEALRHNRTSCLLYNCKIVTVTFYSNEESIFFRSTATFFSCRIFREIKDI
ncbi:hypothetical protein [Desulfosporosinus sp.]|uniref:hypothetical protein n=1 Tax=Desulfosporosinus sp. TaxID=157907 RepID=UPI002602EF0F|nr:hypothetical protein [Desulfosporosinus sp.]